MYFPAPSGLYYLLGRGACSGLASSAPNVCDICTYFFVTNVSGSIFSFSFSGLKLSQPVFFIKIAALRAYLDDVSLDFVVMLRHVYPSPLLSMCSFFPLKTFGTLTEYGARFALLVRISRTHHLSSTPGTLSDLLLDRVGPTCDQQLCSQVLRRTFWRVICYRYFRIRFFIPYTQQILHSTIQLHLWRAF